MDADKDQGKRRRSFATKEHKALENVEMLKIQKLK
jgi:hypothetical protein